MHGKQLAESNALIKKWKWKGCTFEIKKLFDRLITEKYDEIKNASQKKCDLRWHFKNEESGSKYFSSLKGWWDKTRRSKIIIIIIIIIIIKKQNKKENKKKNNKKKKKKKNKI